METSITITFLSDWHISSGLGDGYRADAVLVRDADGFPYIPGRAVKGALREGARRLGLCRVDLARAENFFWGTRQDSVDSNESGRLRVSAAKLPEVLREQCAFDLPDRATIINDLTIIRSQTALTDKGVAKATSLRFIECGIAGLELTAQLSVAAPKELTDEWLSQYFAAVCAAVKSIGGNRSRGFGLCCVALAGQKGPTLLPAEQPCLKELGGD